MTRGITLKLTGVILLALSFSMLAAKSPVAHAQDQRERDLKIKVGRTRAEAAAGRAEKVELWAVLVGVSRYKNGDQNIGGYEIKNLKNAADDAQAINEFLRSD